MVNQSVCITYAIGRDLGIGSDCGFDEESANEGSEVGSMAGVAESLGLDFWRFSFFSFFFLVLLFSLASGSSPSLCFRFFVVTDDSFPNFPSTSFSCARTNALLIAVSCPPTRPPSAPSQSAPFSCSALSFSLFNNASNSLFCFHATPLGSRWCCAPMPIISSFCWTLRWVLIPSPEGPRPWDASHPNFER